MAVPYRLSPGGDAIMVPTGDALRLRMALAEEGMPVGGTVGYELFDQANPFTTSDFLGNVNLRGPSRASSRARSARCAASVRLGSISSSPSAACSAARR